MNIFCFTGNLGRNAETRYSANGTAICSFSVAVKSGYGEREKTLWVRCSMFGKRAEGGLVPYLVKGQQVAVSGELSLNEYQGNDGQTRTSLEVNIRDITLLGGRSDNSGAPNQNHAPQQQPQAPQQQQAPQQSAQSDSYEDDIPF